MYYEVYAKEVWKQIALTGGSPAYGTFHSSSFFKYTFF